MSYFDSSSGLVYTKKTSGRVRSMIPKWATSSLRKPTDPSKYVDPGPGCPTLYSMALRACVWNIDFMEPEALQCLGWHYADRLYHRIKETRTSTFETWMLFLKAFPEEIDRHATFGVFEKCVKGTYLPLQLPSVVDRLAKLDISMLTFLCLQNFFLTIDHLIALTKLDKLAVLVLERKIRYDGRVHDAAPDHTLRDWGRSVYESGAFKKLKVLVFGDFGHDRNAVLKGVSCFPVLDLVGILDDPAREIHTPQDKVQEWVTGTSVPVERDPTSIWDNRTTTKAEKMMLEYELSYQLSRKPHPDRNSYRSVSILYVGDRAHVEGNKVAWFYRELKDDAGTQLTKRPGSDNKPNVEEGDRSKKRKVREGKGIDMASLLGTFT